EVLSEIRARPVLAPFRDLADASLARRLIDARARVQSRPVRETVGAPRDSKSDAIETPAAPAPGHPRPVPEDVRLLLDDAEARGVRVFEAAAPRGLDGVPRDRASEMRATLEAALTIDLEWPRGADPAGWMTLLGWMFTRPIGAIAPGERDVVASRL